MIKDKTYTNYDCIDLYHNISNVDDILLLLRYKIADELSIFYK